MSKIYQKLPNDPFFTEMDPVLKLWMFNQWVGDHKDNAELAKNHAYLIGSFTNPEAVQKLMNDKTHESSDEDFEESLKMVRDANVKLAVNEENKKKSELGRNKRKKKRAKLKEI